MRYVPSKRRPLYELHGVITLKNYDTTSGSHHSVWKFRFINLTSFDLLLGEEGRKFRFPSVALRLDMCFDIYLGTLEEDYVNSECAFLFVDFK
jgi:hypothetical protein